MSLEAGALIKVEGPAARKGSIASEVAMATRWGPTIHLSENVQRNAYQNP